MSRACARTTERKTLTSRYDGESASSSGSSRLDQPSASCPLMPPSTTPSPYNATLSPAAPFGFSGPKQYKLGRLRPLPREGARHPGLYEFTPIRVTVPAGVHSEARPTAE